MYSLWGMVKNAYTLYKVLRSKTAMFKWIINDEQYRKKELSKFDQNHFMDKIQDEILFYVELLLPITYTFERTTCNTPKLV